MVSNILLRLLEINVVSKQGNLTEHRSIVTRIKCKKPNINREIKLQKSKL